MQDGSSPANVKLQLLQYSTSINGDQESNWCNLERIQTHLVACMDIPTILPYFSLLVILSTFFSTLSVFFGHFLSTFTDHSNSLIKLTFCIDILATLPYFSLLVLFEHFFGVLFDHVFSTFFQYFLWSFKPTLCMDIPAILPYFWKIFSTSVFTIWNVFRFPTKTLKVKIK